MKSRLSTPHLKAMWYDGVQLMAAASISNIIHFFDLLTLTTMASGDLVKRLLIHLRIVAEVMRGNDKFGDCGRLLVN